MQNSFVIYYKTQLHKVHNMANEHSMNFLSIIYQ